MIRPRKADATAGWVGGIVALDPALEGVGYATSTMNFSAVSSRSWAFYGEGLFGSRRLAGTADEAFKLGYGTLSVVNVDPFERHSAPIHLFTSIVQRNLESPLSPLAALFSLDKLITPTSRPWRLNSSGAFEGTFELRDRDGDSRWGDNWLEVTSLSYVARNGRPQVLPA